MFVLDCIWVRKNEANNFYEHKQFINFNPMVGNLFVEHYFFWVPTCWQEETKSYLLHLVLPALDSVLLLCNHSVVFVKNFLQCIQNDKQTPMQLGEKYSGTTWKLLHGHFKLLTFWKGKQTSNPPSLSVASKTLQLPMYCHGFARACHPAFALQFPMPRWFGGYIEDVTQPKK